MGFLSACYALLLRPAASVLSSPKARATRGMGDKVDVRSTFRSCLEIPTVAKSLTFAKNSLLPAIGIASLESAPSRLETDFAFHAPVLSDFAARYLDAVCALAGELPISRAKWISDERQELHLRHIQEGQRRQFVAWSGNRNESSEVIPEDVDILKRPDCLDDVIALVVALCSAFPDGVRRFWHNCSIGDVEVSSNQLPRAARELARLQQDEPSLLAPYASLLAVFSLGTTYISTDSGADAVHRWLSGGSVRDLSPPSSPSVGTGMDWSYVLDALRWYSVELGGKSSNCSVGISRTSPSNRGDGHFEENTDYYYNTNIGGDSATMQNKGRRSSDGGVNQSSTVGITESIRQLNDIDTLNILSLLGLLSAVVSRSDTARDHILNLYLQPRPGSSLTTSGDDALSILFSLVVASVTSDIRGATFTAIADLLHCDNIVSLPQDKKERLLSAGRRGWEYLERCRTIPISSLSQYAPFQDGNVQLSMTRTQVCYLKKSYKQMNLLSARLNCFVLFFHC